MLVHSSQSLKPDVGAPKPKPDIGVFLHPKFVLKLKAKLWADLLALVVCWCSKPNVVVAVAPSVLQACHKENAGEEQQGAEQRPDI